MTENDVPPKWKHTVSVRALQEAHPGGGPSRGNNKQANYRYKEITTVDIAAEYTVRANSDSKGPSRPKTASCGLPKPTLMEAWRVCIGRCQLSGRTDFVVTVLRDQEIFDLAASLRPVESFLDPICSTLLVAEIDLMMHDRYFRSALLVRWRD